MTIQARTPSTALSTGRAPSPGACSNALAFAARASTVAIALGMGVLALDYGQVILAPIVLAVVIGLVFGPLADLIERFGIPAWISAIAVVVGFLFVIVAAVAAFAVPLADWFDRLPKIWLKLQSEASDWKVLFRSVSRFQEELRAVTGQTSPMRVAVDDGSPVVDAATLAPTIFGQVLLFLASLYFFIATRHRIRISILSLCLDRRLRWRLAHVFRDVEKEVSGYLVQITLVNAVLGAAVALALWIAGTPSPLLWGILAAVLNYAVYVGPAAMTVILLGVGLATGTGLGSILLPAMIFLSLNLLEAQFVTPTVIGRRMTVNPFTIFLALVFWIWIWGPVGGLVAIPSVIAIHAILRNVVGLESSKPAPQS